MNFYGHCWLARFDRDEAAFALGSMLPDFAGMSGARLVRADHEAIAAGVSHHHAVDAVFHAAPTFVRLCQTSGARLDASGVRWGTGRAVAHIGVELLLDGVLLVEGEADALYAHALREAAELGASLTWSRPEASARFDRLCVRLLELGTHPDHGSAEVVNERLHRALADRPRLCISPADSEAVRHEIERLHPEVHAAADELLREVRDGLATRRASESPGSEL